MELRQSRDGKRIFVGDVGEVDSDDVPKAEAWATARLFAASQDLLDVARAYEAWEAELILCSHAWNHGRDGLPTLTQALWDKLLEIQTKRNAAVKKATDGRWDGRSSTIS